METSDDSAAARMRQIDDSMNHSVGLCGFAHERRGGELCSTQDRSANIVCPHSIWNIVVPQATERLLALGIIDAHTAADIIVRWEGTQITLSAADTAAFSAAEAGQPAPLDSAFRQWAIARQRQRIIAELRVTMRQVRLPEPPLEKVSDSLDQPVITL